MGCLFKLFFRAAFLLILVGAIAFGVYYFKQHPEKAPWRSGFEGVKEKAESLTLGTQVKAALELRDAFKRLKIDVGTERDVVTLRGKVPSAALSREAEAVVAAVPGVRQVVNFLEIDEKAASDDKGDTRTMGERLDDEALEVKVRAAFKLDRELKDGSYKFSVLRKVVSIEGAFKSDAERKHAESVARAVQGVQGVSSKTTAFPTP